MKSKKVFYLIFAFVFVGQFSCNKNIHEHISTDPLVSLFVNNFDGLSFARQFGSDVVVNIGQSKKVVFLYQGIPEEYIVTPISDVNKNELGKIYSLKKHDSTFNSIVINTLKFDKKNGIGEISYYSVGIPRAIKFLINQHKLVSYEEVEIVSGFKIKASSTKSQAESSCTGTCYKRAKDACDADADCKLLCDILPSCNGSIAVACFLHCMFR